MAVPEALLGNLSGLSNSCSCAKYHQIWVQILETLLPCELTRPPQPTSMHLLHMVWGLGCQCKFGAVQTAQKRA